MVNKYRVHTGRDEILSVSPVRTERGGGVLAFGVRLHFSPHAVAVVRVLLHSDIALLMLTDSVHCSLLACDFAVCAVKLGRG